MKPDLENARENREFLKDSIRKQIDFSRTDQGQGKSAPMEQKPVAANARCFPLPPYDAFRSLGTMPLIEAIRGRQSRRRFQDEPLSLPELSFLLWSTQGVRKWADNAALFRTVPSAGARHSFETYVVAFRVDSLAPAVYRYLPMDHQLVLEYAPRDMAGAVKDACLGQSFAASGAALFVWTTIPYRTEWRYGAVSHKVIAVDAGHVCQNLYLACEAIGAGTCAIGAYDQERMDDFLRVDGRDEFACYMAPVGRVRTRENNWRADVASPPPEREEPKPTSPPGHFRRR